ncbi:MAG: glycoside hydrolase family 10 protein [Porcipelethomonas sp.]
MKRKIFIIISVMLLLCSCGEETADNSLALNEQTLEQLQIPELTSENKTEYQPVNYETQKAVWFTMMDYEDLLYNKSEEEFTQNIEKLLGKIKDAGFNTVYLHVRSYNDAYYKSDMFPPGQYCNVSFDPLLIILDKAHSLELSVHGWINPLRCQTDEELKSLDEKYTIKKWYDDSEKNGTYICMADDRWYLNPAYEEVRKYISDGVREIAGNYDLDGIHIDDYFYPTQNEEFDEKAFKESGQDDLKQWRTENINSMVRGIYDTVKGACPEMLFGISPQGNISIDENNLYADVETWCSEKGYCDYIAPQIYYGFKNENLPFEETVSKWQQLNTCEDVSLVVGICMYKIGSEDQWAGSGINEWVEDKNIPSREAEFVFEKGLGTAIYSVESLMDSKNADELKLLSELFAKQEDL